MTKPHTTQNQLLKWYKTWGSNRKKVVYQNKQLKYTRTHTNDNKAFEYVAWVMVATKTLDEQTRKT